MIFDRRRAHEGPLPLMGRGRRVRGVPAALAVLPLASLLACSLLPGVLHSAEGEGTSGGLLARLPLGARSLGLGGAHGSLPASPEMILVNPATLARLDSIQMGLAYHQGLEGLSYNGVVAAAPVSGRISVGAAIDTLSAGTIDAYDYTGNHYDADLEEDRLVAAGGSVRFGPASFGVSLKYLSSLLLGLVKSNTTMMDLGVGLMLDMGGPRESWMPRTEDWLYLEASASNIGDAVQYGVHATDSDPVPTTYRLGGSLARDLGGGRRVMIVLAGDVPRSTARPELRGGAEFRFPVGFLTLDARGGARLRHDGSTFSAGAGIVVRGIGIDYAYVGPYGPFAATHHFSVGISFGSLKKSRREGSSP